MVRVVRRPRQHRATICILQVGREGRGRESSIYHRTDCRVIYGMCAYLFALQAIQVCEFMNVPYKHTVYG